MGYIGNLYTPLWSHLTFPVEHPQGSGLQVSQYSPAQYAQPPPQQPFRGNGQHPQGQLPANVERTRSLNKDGRTSPHVPGTSQKPPHEADIKPVP
ncbi:hypothetical protein V495_00991 [Pseudogymnoascus sp. VKM F-4514 (FW-929)]|nr:hypothetical protein V495_00991 [Pseudogymnoascus sp. VKM F-4514 (FW-929)]